ncbi:MAG TPA: hypothetical protein VFG10_15270 [Saprospiraceae bacterium]|nr:hypothetical protein [Saprospiraceae bacterium]
MKNLLGLLLLSCLFSQSLTAQVGIEAQSGGANFLGLTINTRFSIPLDGMYQSLSPSFGVGMLMPGWDEPTLIINAGLTYTYKSWGIGAEMTGFTDNPFIAKVRDRNWVDMIIYPNLNYTGNIGSRWYFRLSAGPYFAFSRPVNSFNEIGKLRFQGDVFPGAGVTIGYKL